MTDKFEIGEVAIYVRPGSPYYGCEVMVTGPLELKRSIDLVLGQEVEAMGYQIYADSFEIYPGHDRYRSVRPEHLRKKPRSIDREATGEWDLCPWRPEKVNAKPSR